MRSTAAVFEPADNSFVIGEVELEEPRATEVLVHIRSVGICATDLEAAKHSTAPAVFGHEGAGVVVQVGANVASVQPGDHVALAFNSCGQCRLCLAAKPSYCNSFNDYNFTGRRPDGTSAVSREGVPLDAHFLGQSSFASHAVVPERAVVPINAALGLDHVGPFGCGVQTGAGAVLNVLQPPSGSSIAVFGVGGVGSSALLAAHLADCSVIVAVDVSDDRLTASSNFGATHMVNSARSDAVAELAEIVTDGLQFVIDTTGRADVLRAGVDALGPLGHAGVIGIGPSETMSFEWATFLGGRSVTGIVSGGTVPQLFVPRLLELHAAGRFPIDQMYTYFPFAEINEAVAMMRAGDVTKPVLLV